MITGIAPLVPHVGRRVRPEPSGHAAFRLGLLGVIVHFVVSPNLLMLMGVDYAATGGNPLIKLHPATYIVVLGAIAAVFRGGRPADRIGELLTDSPGLTIFLILTLDCALYSAFFVGFSGSAVYIETFLSAGLLAVALDTGTDKEQRILGYVFLGFCVLNAVISLGESLTRTELIPLVMLQQQAAAAAKLGPQSIEAFRASEAMDFRAAGLYPHPLTGALVTSMGVFLLIGMKLKPFKTACMFSILSLGLLTFGGRAATGVTAVLLAAVGLFMLLRGLLTRKLSGGLVAAFLGGTLILLPLLIVAATETSIGERLVRHLYYDDSAQVRAVGWHILNYMSLPDVLFGSSLDREQVLEAQIGFVDGAGLENCWLLLFLNLGAIGFVVLMSGLIMFFRHLARKTPPCGWLILVATVIIVSTSNSLAEKGDDLCYLAACMIAVRAFAHEPVEVTSEPVARIPASTQQRKRGMGLRPTLTGPDRGLVAGLPAPLLQSLRRDFPP